MNTYSRLHLHLTQKWDTGLVQFASLFRILQSKCAFTILQMLLSFYLFSVWSNMFAMWYLCSFSPYKLVAVRVQTPKHSGGADIIGSAGAVNPAVQSLQLGQRIQSSPHPSGKY